MRLSVVPLLLLALAGCDQESPELSDTHSIETKITEMPICWIKRNGKDEPVNLEKPYACFIGWNAKIFILYSKADESVVRTSDYSKFLVALRNLPQKVEILQIDYCSGSASLSQLPNEAFEDLVAAMKSRKLSWAECPMSGRNTFILCTCESDGLRFPRSTEQ